MDPPAKFSAKNTQKMMIFFSIVRDALFQASKPKYKPIIEWFMPPIYGDLGDGLLFIVFYPHYNNINNMFHCSLLLPTCYVSLFTNIIIISTTCFYGHFNLGSFQSWNISRHSVARKSGAGNDVIAAGRPGGMIFQRPGGDVFLPKSF